MATWTTIQTSDLYDYLCVTQLNALRNLELAGGQANPIYEIIGDVTTRIRAEISGNKNNLLSSDRNKLPGDLKSFACHLILEYAQTRLPGLKLTDDQIRLANDAKEYLKRVARGEIPISVPDDDAVTNDFAKTTGCEIVHHRENRIYQKCLGGF
ncbi:MAG: hypothetical protein LBB18_00340 [Puniceicoccales bacterium]|jgi:phage gp36-like protein|nr:hypothetical protein [Puniceicoccales bacterium]